MKFLRHWLYLWLAALLLAPTAHAEPVRFYYFDSDPPYSWQDESGHAQGHLIEALDYLAEKAGITLNYQTAPWPRAQKMVQHGQLDAFLTLADESRQRYALFTKTPVLTIQQRIYHRSDDHRFDHLADLSALHGLTQISLIGGGSGPIVDPDHVAFVHDSVAILEMLASGRADYVVCDPILMAPLLENGNANGQIVNSDAPFLKPLDFRFGLRKDYPNAETLIATIDKAIRAAKRSGKIDRLLHGRN